MYKVDVSGSIFYLNITISKSLYKRKLVLEVAQFKYITWEIFPTVLALINKLQKWEILPLKVVLGLSSAFVHIRDGTITLHITVIVAKMMPAVLISIVETRSKYF